MTILFITGDNKVVVIGPVKQVGSNLLEMILRESGRFILRDKDEFIALSEKKIRAITVSGSIAAGSSAEHFHSYDDVPTSQDTTFESGDMFPQDLLQEYKVDKLEIYGIALLLDMSLTVKPPDAVPRLKGVHTNLWITRQPQTNFAPEDCVGGSFSAYQSTPENGLVSCTEGVLTTTVKKKLKPAFVPIKSSFVIDKTKDKLYVYKEDGIVGYCEASTGGGTVTGSAVFEHRLIVGQGFLPEEVEELLSPSQ